MNWTKIGQMLDTCPNFVQSPILQDHRVMFPFWRGVATTVVSPSRKKSSWRPNPEYPLHPEPVLAIPSAGIFLHSNGHSIRLTPTTDRGRRGPTDATRPALVLYCRPFFHQSAGMISRTVSFPPIPPSLPLYLSLSLSLL